jgi:hypothetical protein
LANVAIHYAAAELHAIESADRKLARFVVSTATEDRANRRVNPDGWDLAAYRENPVVLWEHGFDTAVPVATCPEIAVKAGRLEGVADFTETAAISGPMGEFAAGVYDLVAAKVLRMASAAWRGLEYAARYDADDRYLGMDYARQELVEWSLVPIGSNPDALRIARASGCFNDQGLERVFAPRHEASVSAGHQRRTNQLTLQAARGRALQNLQRKGATP